MRTLHALATGTVCRAGLLALTLIGSAAAAQDNTVIGPPQLKDFQLEPRERIVTQPQAEPQPQPQTQQPAAPAPVAADPGTPRATAAEPRERAVPRQVPRPAPDSGAQAAPPPAAATTPADALENAAPPPISTDTAIAPPAIIPPAPLPPAPAEYPTQAPERAWWPFLLAGAALLLGGLLLWRRRRTARAEQHRELAHKPAVAAPAAPSPVSATPPLPPRPAPQPAPAPALEPAERPWIELELVAKRAAFTDAEASVQFELVIRNVGAVDAHNIRVDVKLLNAGAEQDTEIDAFFETAGRLATKVNFPHLPADKNILIDGEVGMPHAEMRALQLSGRLLFIPVVAVNVLYDWGQAQRGQTSRSYLVGREPSNGAQKMGPFHIDQGPRIWRSVDQRSHKVERRR